MVVSMTGYGKAILSNEQYKIHIEMKAVNHRYLETIVRMPRQLLAYEDAIKKIVAEYTSRGRVEVFVTIEGLLQRSLQIDEGLIQQYKNAIEHLSGEDQNKSLYNPIDLLKLPEVTTVSEVEQINDNFEELLLTTSENACQQFFDAKCKEGGQLKKDLIERLTAIEECKKQITVHSPLVLKSYREKLQSKLAEVELTAFDEQRLLTEIMLFADRCDISEELVRLTSHLELFNETLQIKESIGRKLDFIVQEMNREVNTIGSKANSLDISKQVVEIKNNLEKIREQVQNIE
ncbi:YicC family protein [Bacillus sp. AFS077874]|uniref:YicC/YloC family endoribonuclease n=1 Tax=unclassified Bacillus (in: firmicutes) TaxID=185979 RepID=UPI000BED6A3C|nr:MULTISPECIES: YicC/YloC family endoribonuclease [unclassified Bacillus (in: firmicutes)]PEC49784.1 YicC family protein [Bacillus sp. AFS096315]PFM79541.1 YicC family protein [Bacillus sp. AFS077874]